MTTPASDDPAIYRDLREQILRLRLPDRPPGAVHAVVMDWHMRSGGTTVVAVADGTASIYLASGGGLIGGSQAAPAIREAALLAIQIAQKLVNFARLTEWTPIAPAGIVSFYLTTSEGVRGANTAQMFLRDGTHPLTELGVAMQNIVTQYRLWDEQRKAAG